MRPVLFGEVVSVCCFFVRVLACLGGLNAACEKNLFSKQH